jgi:sugar O-acyltransferase (sialic acid O-acetyltransferase NeuD family)
MHIEYFMMGAGGHAKVVIDATQLLGIDVEVYDDDVAKVGKCLLGLPVRQAGSKVVYPPQGHVAIGNNAIRACLHARLSPLVRSWFNVVHPNACLARSATLEEGVFIGAQAVVGPQAFVASLAIINHGAVVDHDCHIGKYCHVAPHATLGGSVELGDGVFVGSNATLLPGIRVGNNAMIGAGAVVTRDVPTGTTVLGIPARIWK